MIRADEDNEVRAEWALTGLDCFAQQVYALPADLDLDDQDSYEQAVSDFIADLLHLCDRRARPGEDGMALFSRLFQRGIGHYVEEKNDEEDVDPDRPLRLVDDL